MDLQEYRDLLARWQELDRQAVEAENRLKNAGQLATGPEAAAWIREAADKRRAADTCLLRLLRAPQAQDKDTD